MGWATTTQVKQSVADSLHEADVGNLNVMWDRLIAEAVDLAKQDITGKLQARGYTLDQIESWDYLENFSKSQAKFWAFTHGGGPADYDGRSIAQLDRRKELDSLVLMIGGVSTPPGGETGVGFDPAYGSMYHARRSGREYDRWNDGNRHWPRSDDLR